MHDISHGGDTRHDAVVSEYDANARWYISNFQKDSRNTTQLNESSMLSCNFLFIAQIIF